MRGNFVDLYTKEAASIEREIFCYVVLTDWHNRNCRDIFEVFSDPSFLETLKDISNELAKEL